MTTKCLFQGCLLTALMFSGVENYAQTKSGEVILEGYYRASQREAADKNDQSLNWLEKPMYLDNPRKVLGVDGFGDNLRRWQLVREKKQTVLHCYMSISKSIKGLWLGGDETYIVDAETGTHYKARGTFDKSIWGEEFAMKISGICNFPIYFPPLPESVKEIYIYGVPRWGLRGGNKLRLNGQVESGKDGNQTPLFHTPRLVEKKDNYNRNDMGTYDVYGDLQLIKPAKPGLMAIWRTPETTYLAVADELNWNREYYTVSSETTLIDEKTRKSYKIKRAQGLPMDTMFFFEGIVGDWVAYVLEFEPLPEDVKTISFNMPEVEPFHVWGANWAAQFEPGLQVKDLENNQALFKYSERKVVK